VRTALGCHLRSRRSVQRFEWDTYHGDALPTELRGPVFSCLTWGFAPHGGKLRSCTAVLPASHPAAPRSWTRTTDLGEITALLLSWRLRLEASNLSPRTIRAYMDNGAPGPRSWPTRGIPTAARNTRTRARGSLHRGGARAAILGVRRDVLPLATAALQLAGRRARDPLASPLAKMRSPKTPAKPLPDLSEHPVRLLLADCSGKDFRNR
jgi:hypothetical protein